MCLINTYRVQDEVRNLKKQKLELELRIKDQEEELDDMAGQVQIQLDSSTLKNPSSKCCGP
jgi:hypothetical protein